MFFKINGEDKKVACGPCIRGHRSSKCKHEDRVLIEVRKPGRPLTTCPHPAGSTCNCTNKQGILLPIDARVCGLTTAASQGTNRVQKQRRKKSTTTLTPIQVEKALNNGQYTEHALINSPNSSPSNAGSPTSSVGSSTRIDPMPAKGSCCGSKPTQQPAHPPPIKPEEERLNYDMQKLVVSYESGNCAVPSLNMHNQEAPKTPFDQGRGRQGPFSDFGFPALQAPVSHFPANGPSQHAAMIHSHLSAMQQARRDERASLQRRASVDDQSLDRICGCGPSCTCFACVVHPYNETMAYYARRMARYQVPGRFGPAPPPNFDSPNYVPQPGFNPAPPHGSFYNPSAPMPVFDLGGAGFDGVNSPDQTQTPWAAQNGPAPLPASLGGQIPRQASLQTNSTSNPANLNFKDGFGNDAEEDKTALSPSDYVYAEFNLGSCTDVNGICHCGDGCKCDGCVVHGHNNIPLSTPTATESAEGYSRMMEDLALSGLDMSGLDDLSYNSYSSMPFSSEPS